MYRQFDHPHPMATGRALYLVGVLLQDLQLSISAPNPWLGGLPSTKERIDPLGYLSKTTVYMTASIHGPSVFDQVRSPVLLGDPADRSQWDTFMRTVDAFAHLVDYRGCGGSSLIALGPGHICHHCGNYSPSGSLRCWRCGGDLEMVDFIHPVRFPFYAAERPRNGGTNWRSAIAFDLMAEVDDVETEVMPFFLQDPRLLPAGCSLDTGLYLCKYCGYAVQEGHICPGCGGERVPLMELIDLDRECRYCGSTMRGGIVCPDCGARIAGTALRELWRER